MKRCISFLLALILLLSLVPVCVFADSAQQPITMQASTKIRDFIKDYEGAVLDSNGNHVAYQDVYGNWTIGYGHTGYVPCRNTSVCSGMAITQQEADALLLYDLNQIYAPSVNNFVNSHRNLYPDGFTQYEFDVLVSLAFGFGAYWIDYYKDSYRICKYLLNGIRNYSDQEIADAIVCLWSGLNGLLYRRIEEARIFLYGDYDGTGSRQLTYLKFSGATTVFSDDNRSGNRVACFIKGASYGELPTASKSGSYFAGWKTSDGRILKSSDIAGSSMEVTAAWSSSKPAAAPYKLNAVNCSSEGNYAAGSTVRVIPDTSRGRTFSYWSGDVTPVRNSDGSYSFTMPAKNISLTANYGASKCTYGADCPSRNFADITKGYWAHAQIDYAVENKLFNGTSTTTFSPETSMTRAMLVTVLYRMAGSPDVSGLENIFSDVKQNSYYNAILWAADRRIANGFDDGSFRPDKPVSRAQFATFLQRFASNIFNMDTETAAYADLSKYSDAAKVETAYRESMSWAVGEKIINGTSTTTLGPNEPATRAQVAVILYRFLENT